MHPLRNCQAATMSASSREILTTSLLKRQQQSMHDTRPFLRHCSFIWALTSTWRHQSAVYAHTGYFYEYPAPGPSMSACNYFVVENDLM